MACKRYVSELADVQIVYLSNTSVPSSTADSVHVMMMCNALAVAGHRVKLHCYLNRGNEAGGPFEPYGLKGSFELEDIPNCRFRGMKRIRRIGHVFGDMAARPRPDLYYSRDIYSLAAVAARGVALIFEAHTPPRSLIELMLLRCVVRKKNFTRLVVITTALRGKYRQLLPFLADSQIVVAADAAEPLEPGRNGIVDQRWPGRKDVIQVGYVGSAYRGKGTELVVSLARCLPQFDFHIVGGTPDEVEGLRASAGGARNLYLHGRVPHRRVSWYLAKYDIALFPGQHSVILRDGTDIGRWTSPMKIFEYMAAGKAIIGTDIESTREVLCDQVNAVLVPPEDERAWAQAIQGLAGNSVLRARLGARAKDDWKRRYTWAGRVALVLQDAGNDRTNNRASVS